MKKEDFDKNIQIYLLSHNEILVLTLHSILYTPIPYRIPVSFAETQNSADDTEKYIKENYSIEEQKILKHNHEIDSQFFKEYLKLSNPSEDEINTLANKYKDKLKEINYTPPNTLRSFTIKDTVNKMNGYCVIDANALIGNNGDLLVEFLNLDFDNFNDFFVFFTKYFGIFIDLIDEKDIKNLKIDEITDIDLIINIANKIYSSSKPNIISIQTLFKKFVNLLYSCNDNDEIASLTIQQKFYIFFEENKDILNTFATNYRHSGFFSFDYTSMDKEKLKHKNTKELIAKLKKFDKDGKLISNNDTIVSENIYTIFYISLYYLVLNNNAFIRQCKNCHKYFHTTKSNILYCDNLYYDKKTCKEVGNQLSQKRKENNIPVYKKYRSIFATKATLLKRNPDIYSKEDYENWKNAAQCFWKDVKNGLKTEDEFYEWLNKNK